MGCIGCLNIKNNSFPFMIDGDNGDVFIDNEGCGENQENWCDMLQIFYCPVCGKKL